MKESEKILLRFLNDSDDLEIKKGTSRSSAHLALKNIIGNPIHVAQFNIEFSIYYYSQPLAAFIAPAGLPGAIQTVNKAVVFGNADFASNFAKAKTYIPDLVWVENIAGIWGRDVNAAGAAVIAPHMQDGDLLFYDTSAVGGGYWRFTIIRCPQTAYGSLLDAVGSDTFILNMIRYRVDPTQLGQLNNQIIIGKQSIFGKTLDDKVDPGTYVTSNTINQNIADIPINLGIDKHVFLATYINYDVQNFSWVVTVKHVKKLRA